MKPNSILLFRYTFNLIIDTSTKQKKQQQIFINKQGNEKL